MASDKIILESFICISKLGKHACKLNYVLLTFYNQKVSTNTLS